MKRINFLALALAAVAAPLCIVLSAKADLAQLNDGAPVLYIKSSGGQIIIRPGEPDGMVRVPGNPQGVRMERFNVKQNMGTVVLPPFHGNCGRGPRGLRPCPGGWIRTGIPLREGPHGVSITNPSGDLSVGVPSRFEAAYINAGASPVLMEQTRGPFVIVGESDVTLHGVTGRGIVRTTHGTVDIRNPAGALRIETQSGPINVQSGPALGVAQIESMDGDITWTLAGTGSGPYRVNAGSGVVRLLVRPGVGANINAVSEQGIVVNNLDPSAADVLLSRPHAVSLNVGGGGAQITIHSVSGMVIIAPATTL